MEVVVKENDVMVDVVVTTMKFRFGRFLGLSSLIYCSIEEASSGWSWLRASMDDERKTATADASSLSQTDEIL